MQVRILADILFVSFWQDGTYYKYAVSILNAAIHIPSVPQEHATSTSTCSLHYTRTDCVPLQRTGYRCTEPSGLSISAYSTL